MCWPDDEDDDDEVDDGDDDDDDDDDDEEEEGDDEDDEDDEDAKDSLKFRCDAAKWTGSIPLEQKNKTYRRNKTEWQICV